MYCWKKALLWRLKVCTFEKSSSRKICSHTIWSLHFQFTSYTYAYSISILSTRFKKGLSSISGHQTSMYTCWARIILFRFCKLGNLYHPDLICTQLWVRKYAHTFTVHVYPTEHLLLDKILYPVKRIVSYHQRLYGTLIWDISVATRVSV